MFAKCCKGFLTIPDKNAGTAASIPTSTSEYQNDSLLKNQS
jgi:hypothetical protein